MRSKVLQQSLFTLVSLVALLGFSWPLILPAKQELNPGYLVVVAVAALAFIAIWVFDRTLVGANYLALLGTLSALGAATRIATSGVAGFELVFLIVILGGAAIGAGFGFQLGALTVLVSSILFGGFGPWTPFQLFAVGWVGLGAGLVGKLRLSSRPKVVALAAYAVVSSYLFGLIMNLWFWPFALTGDSTISYDPTAPISDNLASFLLYTLTTSTLGWDSVRAIVLVISILLLGPSVLAILRRTKL
jgi:energy-coupling factor transport system ATP-binding protein